MSANTAVLFQFAYVYIYIYNTYEYNCNIDVKTVVYQDIVLISHVY